VDGAAPARAPALVAPGRARRLATAPSPLHFGRARALLKVQDGCDAFCAYCIVPYVRGRSRSVPRSDVLAQARRLLDAGFRELVLTGADLGSYCDGERGSRAKGNGGDLAGLVRAILALAPRHRVRLSSIEPNKVDDVLVELMAEEPRLCRHLHLPLQSGSASVLRGMRRAYAPGDYARLVERVAASGPVAIGADVIVGFPGEGEREFAETYSFLESQPITFLHVFRYSPRPGTSAASLPVADVPEVPDAPAASTVRDRAERLRSLGEAKAIDFARSLVGSRRSVVLEARHAKDGCRLGTSDLYVSVALAEASLTPGDPGPLDVRIESSDGEILRGERLAAAASRPDELAADD
jgi:threonylcarbamoyladenosine tRNA methylthiotransferase MtaB